MSFALRQAFVSDIQDIMNVEAEAFFAVDVFLVVAFFAAFAVLFVELFFVFVDFAAI